ncbi:interleukin-17 receptor A-like [Megalops cyprinoides]|uniref:interleukin-17 receptor A-like n=1 Tax=Megalops cyprinoides TaxID=118141 RepID=UPI0018643958|nr:interleukin-17 receptor A-like [Megalops cyprinoides]
MKLLLFVFGLVSALLTVSSLRIIEWPPLNCTQEDLRCSAQIGDCSDEGWVQHRQKTPTSPAWKSNGITVTTRRDERDHLVPAISVTWKARADGSIEALQGTEVRVLKQSSKQSLCVRYIFHNKIMQMMNPRREPWTFSLDRVVVEPGQAYIVSISNLPKPDVGHNMINKTVTIPECRDSRIRGAKMCRENGSLWKPNIIHNVSTEQAVITVSFNSGEFSEKYMVSVQCPDFSNSQIVWKENQTWLNVSFATHQWPRTCCRHDIVIVPFFIQCNNDCAPHQERFDHCVDDPSKNDKHVLLIFILGLILVCGCFLFLLCRKLQKGAGEGKNKPPDSSCNTSAPLVGQPEPLQARGPRKVLIIYSLDHPLYKDVVLKLCAFLRAKCGTDVVLDLLDTAWLGTVGRMQWLDWQKQQIEKSSDKILILCSRGVRAKWRAMCGASKVTLKEDARSPMGDMLTPALSLIIPDFVHSTSFQKYMVAYFDDVSCEDDVPAPFNVTIKYKLMKHFEELYFRIVDMEKHEPGKVNRIEGISEDEYFNCPSGKALRNAIEALQAYQLENPDWFEKECVESEDEAAESETQNPLLALKPSSPILQCVPECREGPPVLVSEVEIVEDAQRTQSVIPVLNQGGERLPIHEFHPAVQPYEHKLCSSHPVIHSDPSVWRAAVHPSVSEGQPCLTSISPMQEPPTQRRNTVHLQEGSAKESSPVEDHEEVPMLSSHLSPSVLDRLQALQWALGPEEAISSTPEEVADRRKRPTSGSDQGYISRSSLQHGSTLGDDSQDPLVALSRLQEACFLNSLKPSGPTAVQSRDHFGQPNAEAL